MIGDQYRRHFCESVCKDNVSVIPKNMRKKRSFGLRSARRSKENSKKNVLTGRHSEKSVLNS